MTKKCRHCRSEFTPTRPMQNACGIPCAMAIARAASDRKQAARLKAERKDDRAKREKMKRRSDWLAECQAVVNKYVRLRDAHLGCVSCGARPAQSFGGTMDAGHFRSVGSAPHMRFYTPQIAAQCVRCNRHLGGNAVEFRRGLVARIGLERVEQIEAMQGTAKWPIEYLKRLKSVFSRKVRRLEKRLEREAA